VEGVWGSLLMLGLVLPLAQHLPGKEGGGMHEDSWESLHMIAGSRALQLVVALNIAGMSVYNVAGEPGGVMASSVGCCLVISS
jgi:hypothetical protein